MILRSLFFVFGMDRTIHVSHIDMMIVPLQVFGDVCIGKIGYMVL